MTLAELIQYLDAHTKFRYLDGDAQQTLTKARTDQHSNGVVGAIIKAIAEKCACMDARCNLERVDVVNALGPMRLKYMADDAPVDGFRTIEGTIIAIDAAFNDEALRERNK